VGRRFVVRAGRGKGISPYMNCIVTTVCVAPNAVVFEPFRSEVESINVLAREFLGTVIH